MAGPRAIKSAGKEAGNDNRTLHRCGATGPPNGQRCDGKHSPYPGSSPSPQYANAGARKQAMRREPGSGFAPWRGAQSTGFLSVGWPVWPVDRLTGLPDCVRPSLFLSFACLSACPSVLPSVRPSVFPCVCPSVCLSVCLSGVLVILCVGWPTCQPVCLSVC